MATYNKTGYFYIGLFTLIGMSLLISAVVILSSKATYKNAIYVETYFNESVQGLTIGSPVKYRGMEVGKIVDIATIASIYNIPKKEDKNVPGQAMTGQYIYVKIAINSRHFQSISDGTVGERIEQEVKNGLRVKISVQGLTGNAYLELDYVKAGANNILPIDWQPENHYIPSTPSTLTFFSDNAQYIVEELRKIELQKTFNSIKKLTDTTKQTLDNVDKSLAAYSHQTMEILINLQEITQNLKSVSERAKTYPSSILFGNPPTKLDPNRL